MVSFYLNRHFTFRDTRRNSVRQFLLFTVLSLSALAMNLGIVFITVEMHSFHYLVEKVCAIGITFFWNYLAQSRFTFHTPDPIG